MIQSNDSFNDLAEKYAALTEVQHAVMLQRAKLFSALVSVWSQLAPAQRYRARDFMSKLNKDCAMQLPGEPMFSEALTDTHERVSRRQK